MLSTLACHCAIKGKALKLYTVSQKAPISPMSELLAIEKKLSYTFQFAYGGNRHVCNQKPLNIVYQNDRKTNNTSDYYFNYSFQQYGADSMLRKTQKFEVILSYVKRPI